MSSTTVLVRQESNNTFLDFLLLLMALPLDLIQLAVFSFNVGLTFTEQFEHVVANLTYLLVGQDKLYIIEKEFRKMYNTVM